MGRKGDLTMREIKLLGRVFIQGDIVARTGLHIGSGSAGVEIGGIDNTVVRDPLTQAPYIPGSALRGKMRFLAERLAGVEQNQAMGPNVYIHACTDAKQYSQCEICPIYGLPSEFEFSGPTRLNVRDVFLDVDSLIDARTEFPYTEIKWEATIDRISSAAVPRVMERVPAGARFKDFEMVYSIYEYQSEDTEEDGKADLDRLFKVFEAMQLLSDEHLGGLGARGSGCIQFENLGVAFRPSTSYGRMSKPITYSDYTNSLESLLEQSDAIYSWLAEQLGW
ncbi:TPA: type III-A CRISPR-associated RAMP protein Csm3 [Candidatus Poribacteria bacterium]|nr:type III-A CRISPR-associated RAMP protein Csm3 [Candidatus Poribacteria bacterium]